MTKISKKLAYGNKNPISDNDYVVGTNGDTIKKETKSFPVHALRDYLMQGLSPETGGQLKITEIEPITVETDISTIVNALNPHYVVGRYEIVCFNINGQIYLLKSQNLTIGFDGKYY